MNGIISSSFSKDGPGSSDLEESFAWFDLTQEDRDRAGLLGPISDQVGSEIIDQFYAHILRFERASEQFTSQSQIDRVKAAQKSYFAELVTAKLNEDYVADRRRIGRIHEVAGITPTLYIGAYAYYLSKLGMQISAHMAHDPTRALELYISLQKIAHFDMALALETYVEAREHTIEMQQREFRELPTPILKLRPGLILIPVVGSLDPQRARNLTISLLEGIRENRARAVVLDITGVLTVDSSVANHLMQTIQAARLMGATSVLTGVSTSVAQSLVKIGISGESLNTAGDLESGIRVAETILAK
jgi:rsbT co-antagonist protein RsbR